MEDYIVKLREKGFKVEKKTLEIKTPMTRGRVYKYKDKFYTISFETIQDLLNLIKIVGTSLVITSSASTEDTYPNEIEIYDYYRE